MTLFVACVLAVCIGIIGVIRTARGKNLLPARVTTARRKVVESQQTARSITIALIVGVVVGILTRWPVAGLMAVAAVLHLIDSADALIEGFRPGVMERLGLGPEVCLGRNPRLVYGRMTGWGQEGTLAQAAGHDINYVALSGLLAMGSKGTGGIPWIPPTIVGDMGGGAMFLAFGLVCGLFEARRSGKGQVVDAAITDGAAMLGSLIHGVNAAGFWGSDNPLRGDAPFYNVFRCCGCYGGISLGIKNA